jgi:serine/threonine protein kinase
MRSRITQDEYHGTQQYLAKETLQGVKHLHDKGIEHRDIKPDNILLAPSNSNGKPVVTPKIVDFGLAKKGTEEPQHHSGPKGTPGYMAPESFSGQSSVKSDVYGVGATQYHLAKGKPFLHTAPSDASLLGIQAKLMEYGEDANNKPLPSAPKKPLPVKTDRNDFINQTMAPDPNARPTVDTALQHPYVTNPLISDEKAQEVLQKAIDQRSQQNKNTQI